MYTLNQAAKATGKSKSTISDAIKKGKVSAMKDNHGSWQIDPAELHRVYPPMSAEQNTEPHQPNNSEHLTEHSNSVQNIIRIKELEAQLESEKKENALLKDMLSDVKDERNKWQKQAQTLLLTQGENRGDRPQTLWHWLGLGRKTA